MKDPHHPDEFQCQYCHKVWKKYYESTMNEGICQFCDTDLDYDDSYTTDDGEDARWEDGE